MYILLQNLSLCHQTFKLSVSLTYILTGAGVYIAANHCRNDEEKEVAISNSRAHERCAHCLDVVESAAGLDAGCSHWRCLGVEDTQG